MPSIGSELITYLKSMPTITALVGSGDSARIYKERAKQGVALPYIVIEVFGGTSAEHLSGISGVASNRIQVDAYAINPDSAYELAEKVRLAPLQMFRGTMGSTFVHNVTSDDSYSEDSDPPVQGSDQRRYWASRDYILAYEEATAAA